MTVKWVVRVCVWAAEGGVGVNWCCVLKVVNKAGEHPRSRCVMHTNQSQAAKLKTATSASVSTEV